MKMLFRGNGRPYRILQLCGLFDVQFWKILKPLNYFIEPTLYHEWYIVINYISKMKCRTESFFIVISLILLFKLSI